MDQIFVQGAESMLMTEGHSTGPTEESTNNTLQDLCSGNPLSRNRKKIHLIRISLLVTTPVLLLLGLTGYFLHESTSKRDQHAEQKQAIYYGRELGDLIHVLQKERDQTALYLSAIGPDTKIYLLDRYAESNLALSTLSAWPVNFDRSHKEHYKSKEAFGNFMSAHRNALDLINPTSDEEIHFYNGEIEILIKWLYEAITLSRFGGIWKSLVTYKKIVTSKEIAGVERALGSTYFANGGYETTHNYLWYLRQVNTFKYEYNTAQLFSEDVPKMSKILTPGSNEDHLFVSVLTYRDQLTANRPINRSVIQAKYYYDNMTLFIDKLFTVQKKLGNDISATLAVKQAESMKNIIIAIILMSIIVALFPIQILSLHTQISDIRNYALVLVSKTEELKQEKIKSEGVLYQMVPKYIASQIKDINNRDSWKGEVFDAATLFVSEIDQFAKMTKEYTAAQVIGLLRETYSIFDQRIESYDVFQFGNIGDKTMIVSGVPTRNHDRHAAEIADLAIDILNCFKIMESQSLPGKVALRIGIHSGSVMAGIVGANIPKYSVFGETVKIATLMDTSGLGNMIHISEPTYSILKRTNRYTFTCRGEIVIKDDKEMMTYWLTGLKGDKHVKHGSSDVPIINVQQASKMNEDKLPKIQPDKSLLTVVKDALKNKNKEALKNKNKSKSSEKNLAKSSIDVKADASINVKTATEANRSVPDLKTQSSRHAAYVNKTCSTSSSLPEEYVCRDDLQTASAPKDCLAKKTISDVKLQDKSVVEITDKSFNDVINVQANISIEIQESERSESAILSQLDVQALQNRVMGEAVSRHFLCSSLSNSSTTSHLSHDSNADVFASEIHSSSKDISDKDEMKDSGFSVACHDVDISNITPLPAKTTHYSSIQITRSDSSESNKSISVCEFISESGKDEEFNRENNIRRLSSPVPKADNIRRLSSPVQNGFTTTLQPSSWKDGTPTKHLNKGGSSIVQHLLEYGDEETSV